MAKKNKQKRRGRLIARLHNDDQAINDWANKQDVISKSLRILILEAIAKYGYQDYIDAKLAEQLGQQEKQQIKNNEDSKGRGITHKSITVPKDNEEQKRDTKQDAVKDNKFTQDDDNFFSQNNMHDIFDSRNMENL